MTKTTALTTTTPAEQFRAEASALMIDAANMTHHELLDEYLRLSEEIDENTTRDEDRYDYKLNDTAQIAVRKRSVVTAAARARFGINFESFDRPSSNVSADF